VESGFHSGAVLVSSNVSEEIYLVADGDRRLPVLSVAVSVADIDLY